MRSHSATTLPRPAIFFCWRGDAENTRRFYEISASLKTGSAASMMSEARLDILNGDYVDAARATLERAARYNDAFAYRDYLCWLFAFGQREAGWAGFEQLKALPNPQVWIAAHVGHRIDRRTWKELREWLLSDPIRTVGQTHRFALAEAVMLNAIDRAPAGDLVESMKAIEGMPLAAFTGGSAQQAVLIPHPTEPASGRAGIFRSALPEAGPTGYKEGDPVPSHLVMFADAYVDLRRGDHAGAVKKFYAMAQLYAIEGRDLDSYSTYALPYFAWSSAKAGDPYKLEAFLDRLPDSKEHRFDRSLAKAFFAGLRGETAAAIAALNRAYDNRPYTLSRPIFTEYQWAEACAWLFEATHITKYRDLALKWARANQVIQPFVAWPYTMEVKLTKSPQERQRALGFALYLDAGSERIADISEAEKRAARSRFEAINPFKEVKGPTRRASLERLTSARSD